MGACDCIITKVRGIWFLCLPLLTKMFIKLNVLQILQAGPGTIAESLIRSLPIILNDYIPGQVG